MILELLATLQERERDNEALRHRLDLLLRRLYGPRGERLDPNQPLLFADSGRRRRATGQPGRNPGRSAAQPQRRCRPHGRRRLPEDLPREPKHHDLTEAERICPGCGQMRVDIGIDRSEQLDYQPASLFVIEHFVHKYACPCCSRRPAPAPGASGRRSRSPCRRTSQNSSRRRRGGTAAADARSDGRQVGAISAGQQPAGQGSARGAGEPLRLSEPVAVVISASKPAMPIAKGLPGPGLLAHVIVSKYVDHLPLYRLENIYERQGLFLPRSTSVRLAGGLRPTAAAAVRSDGRRGAAVAGAAHRRHAGEDAGPADSSCSARRGCGATSATPRIRTTSSTSRSTASATARSSSWPTTRDTCTPMRSAATTACICPIRERRRRASSRWPATRMRGGSFTRRGAADALRSHQALAYYRQLYELERQAKDFSEAQRLQMRQDLSVPILKTVPRLAGEGATGRCCPRARWRRRSATR